MTEDEWKKIKHFKAKDFFDPLGMDFRLITALDSLRHFINKPISVLSSNDPNQKHENNSYHYQGLAVDICIAERGPEFSLLDFLLSAWRFNFTGSGVYPAWKFFGKTVGGLHLDIRPITTMKANWMGVIDPMTGNQVYIAINENNLRKYGVLK